MGHSPHPHVTLPIQRKICKGKLGCSENLSPFTFTSCLSVSSRTDHTSFSSDDLLSSLLYSPICLIQCHVSACAQLRAQAIISVNIYCLLCTKSCAKPLSRILVLFPRQPYGIGTVMNPSLGEMKSLVQEHRVPICYTSSLAE